MSHGSVICRAGKNELASVERGQETPLTRHLSIPATSESGPETHRISRTERRSRAFLGWLRCPTHEES